MSTVLYTAAFRPPNFKWLLNFPLLCDPQAQADLAERSVRVTIFRCVPVMGPWLRGWERCPAGLRQLTPPASCLFSSFQLPMAPIEWPLPIPRWGWCTAGCWNLRSTALDAIYYLCTKAALWAKRVSFNVLDVNLWANSISPPRCLELSLSQLWWQYCVTFESLVGTVQINRVVNFKPLVCAFPFTCKLSSNRALTGLSHRIVFVSRRNHALPISSSLSSGTSKFLRWCPCVPQTVDCLVAVADFY